ncbi:RNA polymerase sigma factor, partial [Gelidibacter sp.]|uniref:RNA polymerase sigma factor n=1 Tax=Gelidibacter sp. TaxID=2018083 RepID=UPI002CB97482
MHNEEELILRLTSTATKDSAFKELLSLYKERLYWHIRKIVVSHDDTDDVLQNTFIKVYKNIHSFKGESKLFSWMYRIATNEALSHLKRNSKLRSIDSQELQDHTIDNLEADVYF